MNRQPGEYADQDRRRELETGLEEAVAESDSLRSEQRRSESLIKDLEADLAAILTERDSLLERIRDDLLPEVAMPWFLAPPGATRGDPPIRLQVPSGARSIGMLIDADDGDRLEIRDAADKEIWSSVVRRIDSPDEALVRIPVERMPPGDYGVKVWREDVLKVDFEVRIELP